MGCDILEAPDERLEPAQGRRLEAVADMRPVDLSPDQASILQDLEVLRDRGLGQRQLVDDVPADAGVPPRQEPEDLHARRMPDRLAEAGELLVGLRTLDGPEVRLLTAA